MTNNTICVFCGEKPGAFRSTSVPCGGTFQFACKACEKELKGLDEAELCRRALVRGLAEHQDKLRDRIELIEEAESHRPLCLRCNSKLVFTKVQTLDNTPNQDRVFANPFSVLPAYCENCGRYEFYNQNVVRKNKYLNYLALRDVQE